MSTEYFKIFHAPSSLPLQIDEASLRDERRTLISVSLPAQISNFSSNSALISTGDHGIRLTESFRITVIHILCSTNIPKTRTALLRARQEPGWDDAESASFNHLSASKLEAFGCS